MPYVSRRTCPRPIISIPRCPPACAASGCRSSTRPTTRCAATGCLVDDPNAATIEIVRWPARGWRPVDDDSGDEGGTTHGVFVSEWRGDILYGRNEAVDGHYILAYADEPTRADETHRRAIPSGCCCGTATTIRTAASCSFRSTPGRSLVPLALPGDDVRPEQFVCFRFDGTRGLYIHPDVWHEGVFALSGTQRFFDQQGAVHARVSVDFAREFGCLLEAPLA